MATTRSRPLVLDVGTATIRLLRAARAVPGDIDLDLYQVAASPKDLVVSTFVEYPLVDPEPVLAAFRAVIKQAKLGYEYVTMLLPDHAALSTVVIGPPRFNRKDQYDAVCEDLAPVMQLPIENWQIGFQPCGVHEGDELLLGIATLRANLLELGGLVQQAGLNPNVIDIGFFNCANLVEHVLLSGENKGKNVALVLLGNETSSVGIFRDGQLRAFLNRPIGGYDFTKQISKHFQSPMVEAENFKRGGEVFFLPEYSPEQDNLYNFSVIRPVFTELTREIFSAIENYLTRFREFSLQEIIVAGGGANFANIEVSLAQHLNTMVKPIADYYTLRVNGVEVDRAARNELAVACGAFFRG